MKRTRIGGALVGLLATTAILMILFFGVGFGMGWVHVSDNPDKSTIEIDKVQLKEDTDKAADATKKFLHESAESLEEGANQVEHAADDHFSPMVDHEKP
ncbi:hypothetical protein [Blastopirellula marina]|uniref:Uncharacterized protein n=1 Tax=Blastopirellula marina TaxID=124 RepID=A0A2S8G8Q4_9BACT|nr:hypothetical protein [Blastopirellula marina]PQO40661.1 hypothetical protein C5Y98_05405 [Blastopirellula marina]PTL45621.1 hypothetical protein C5Y97_05405 [Blastopirellula marina]